MEIFSYAVTALAAYLLGSIPTGYLVAKAKGIDIRSVGSGNIGATNVFRILGKSAGVLVLLADASKGYFACQYLPGFALPPDDAVLNHRGTKVALDYLNYLKVYEWHSILAGVFAILGHNYTCWLKFKGGKGIATTAGVLIALAPSAFLVVLCVFVLVAILTHYISLASVVAAFCLPFSMWWFEGSRTMIAVMALLGALAIYKHKANIKRLLNGTENRFGKKKVAEAPK